MSFAIENATAVIWEFGTFGQAKCINSNQLANWLRPKIAFLGPKSHATTVQLLDDWDFCKIQSRTIISPKCDLGIAALSIYVEVANTADT